jgi:hypothetical protein
MLDLTGLTPLFTHENEGAPRPPRR